MKRYTGVVPERMREAIEAEGLNSPSIAKGLPQPSEGSFDEVEPEGYASSRAGFSTDETVDAPKELCFKGQIQRS